MRYDLEGIEKIAVIGAGLMGHGIAQCFAVKGYSVKLMDLQEEVLSSVLDNIKGNLKLFVQNGIGSSDQIEPVLARISTTSNLKEAVTGAQFVVEAVTEDLETKQALFQRLDELCPQETILATNTSVISISEIAEPSNHKKRIVGTHFWNPPYLVPLVEVIKGQETAPQVIEVTVELLRRIGNHPVRVKKDVPGFVGNRLQNALWREAISIVENGIASPEEVDEVVKLGFGLRLPVLGPLENADMIGLDLTLAIHKYLLKHLDRSPEPPPMLIKKVEAGNLGFKTGKGFQDWSPEEQIKSRTRFQNYLLKTKAKSINESQD